jgi:peroxiredoxin Q/BCP
MTHLKKGDKAPYFKGLNEKGELISLKSFQGKKLILYFYPQDNTPTCTTEACNLRDNYDALKAEGFEILGVSPDSIKKHQNFISKYRLPFSLLVDTDLSTIKTYGVWGPKQMYGKEYDGVHRTTFLIDEQGLIEDILTKVDSKNHADQILEALGVH